MNQGPEWNQKVEAYLDSVRAFRYDMTPVDRERAESAIAKLYKMENLDPPLFIWCQSPWQIAALIVAWSQEKDFRSVDRCANSSDDKVVTKLWQRLQVKIAEEKLVEKFQHLSQGTFVPNSRTFSPVDVDHTFPFLKWAVRLSSSLEESATLSLPELIRNRAPLAVADGPPRVSLIEVGVWRDVEGQLTCENMVEPVYTEQELKISRQDKSPINITILRQIHSHAQQLKARGSLKEEAFKSPATGFGHALSGSSSKFRIFLMSDLLWNFYTQFFILDHFDKSILGDLEEGIRVMRDLIYSCFAGAFFRRVCLLSERPVKFELDERGNYHNADGPSIQFADSYAQYHWHHILMDRDLIEKPETITIELINNERNIEVRRYLMNRYGLANYVLNSGASKVSEDECGTLYVMESPIDELLAVVVVKNSTPEPDGTFKTYGLRVPPGCVTARQAVAWTFRLRPDDYKPVVES